MRCLVVADDLTGACDAAVQFRLRGAKTRVGMPGVDWRGDVLALSTDSRGLPASEAAERIRSFAAQTRFWKPDHVFKKIDSLWRGNVEAEVAVAQQAFECDSVILTPAFPAMGRLVVNGHLLADPLPDWLPLKITALDADSDADLDRITGEGLASGKRILWAGSGGLAAALARALYAPSVLFCIGSEHAVTQLQTEMLQTEMLQTEMLAGREACRIVRIPWGSLSDEQVLAEIGRERFTALLLSGGDTAAQVCRAIGADGIELEGEIQTGVPWGRITGGRYDGMRVATKSGAFGGPDALVKVLQFFA